MVSLTALWFDEFSLHCQLPSRVKKKKEKERAENKKEEERAEKNKLKLEVSYKAYPGVCQKTCKF